MLIGLLTVSVTVYFFVRKTKATTSENSVHFPESQFQSGDIIFRHGRGAVSVIFRNMSMCDKSYSHAGIIHKEGDKTFVYHVIGGERNTSTMRKDKLSDFCGKKEAFSFGVFRSDLDPLKIDSLAGCYFSQHLKFDDKFDLATDDKMYCTELVYKIIREVSAVDNFLPLTTVRKITYCSCDNIFLSPHFKKIYSFKYQ